jgi:phosphoribosylaminoimidazolecarboxamide formyltransferase/IMP cyclohydrolase
MGSGQQSRVHATRLALNKARGWMLRTHNPIIDFYQLFDLKSNKRQSKINATIQYLDRWIDDPKGYSSDRVLRPLFKKEVVPKITMDIYDVLDDLKKNDELCLASDAFFPFRDNIDVAAEYNVKYIVQPGGSVQDENVYEACKEYGIEMVCDGIRKFTH